MLPCREAACACADSWGVVGQVGLSGFKTARVQFLNENMETPKQKELGRAKNLKSGHWKQIGKEKETCQTQHRLENM